MASGYSRTVEFEVTCGTPSAVELPMPPRGVLERVILTQISGDLVDAVCKIYDRKGACAAANDLNVTQSGVVRSIAKSGNFLQIITDAPHYLIRGTHIELKGCAEPEHDGIQIVTEVPSDDELITDREFVGSENSDSYVPLHPLWQTRPFNATTAPVTHLVYQFNKADNADYLDFSVDQAYENKDNQSPTMRSRYSALWLELLADGDSGSATFQIAYTCRADTIV